MSYFTLIRLVDAISFYIGCWWYSQGAKFQKAASFLVRLTQKVAKVWYAHMTGTYPWNINRVGVEVDRGSKVFKMWDAQGYPRATKTVHV